MNNQPVTIQRQGVDSTAFPVEMPLVGVEQLYMPDTSEGVGEKENAEHQQFGVDKDPDREVTRQTSFCHNCRATGDRFHQAVSATALLAISRSPPLTKKEMTYRIRPIRNTTPAISRIQ